MSCCPSFHVHATPSTPPPNPKHDPCTQITRPSELHDPESNRQPIPVAYSAGSQWLRAALLGANDGLISVTSLMIGVRAMNQTEKAMLVSSLAGLVAGFCSTAIGKFVSERASLESGESSKKEKASLPSPLRAAGASALGFAMGGLLPLLAGGFIKSWGVRDGVVCVVSSLGLAGFGAAGAVLGEAKVSKSALMVLVGGWLAMLVTYGVLRLFGLVFKVHVPSA